MDNDNLYRAVGLFFLNLFIAGFALLMLNVFSSFDTTGHIKEATLFFLSACFLFLSIIILKRKEFTAWIKSGRWRQQGKK